MRGRMRKRKEKRKRCDKESMKELDQVEKGRE